MKRSEIELKPCPMCGGKANLEIHRFVSFANTYGIKCSNCDLQTRQFYDTPEEAEKAWNKRVDEGVK